MGVEVKKPFPTYPNGFPKEVLDEFTRLTGYEVLGNKPASGTEIIKELGEEHMRTKKLIVYTPPIRSFRSQPTKPSFPSRNSIGCATSRARCSPVNTLSDV
jgi:phosphopentomutase